MGEIIYSFCKNGKRYDRPQEAIEKTMTSSDLEKGGPGSGRYPKGSGEDIKRLSDKELGRSFAQLDDFLYGGEKDRGTANQIREHQAMSDEINRRKQLSKGGPGSGRYPKGSGEDDINSTRFSDKEPEYKGYKITPYSKKSEDGKIYHYYHIYGPRGKIVKAMGGSGTKNQSDAIIEAQKDIDRMGKLSKQEPIASDEPEISEGAIVSLNGHTGKVLLVEDDVASVSWEDASISEVPVDDLEYEGRVEKGGPGSGRRPEGGRKDESMKDYDKRVRRAFGVKQRREASYYTPKEKKIMNDPGYAPNRRGPRLLTR